MTRSSLRTLVCFAFAALLATLPALALGESGQLVSPQISATQISWQAQRAFGGAELVISAPDGQIYSRQFSAEEATTWSVFDAAGLELIDGNYAWELRLRPTTEPLIRRVGDAAPVVDGKRDFDQFVASGNFSIASGRLIVPSLPEQANGPDKDGGLLVAPKDQVILDDLIVDGSACVGFDCVNGEVFGSDTLRLKENTLRIKFQDTSNNPFPTADWQLTANDSSSGGANKFSIDDIDNGRTPFTVEARAPSHSLYVDDGGRVGLGTSVPVVDLHIVSGNSPALRLEQNGSSGFGSQSWDLAGNETNFFIRDNTNGSTLPVRIRPGVSTNAIYIENNDNVGFGTSSPDAPIELFRSDGSAQILINADAGTVPAERTLIRAVNKGKTRVTLARTDLLGQAGADWSFAHGGQSFEITKTGSGVQELTLNANSGDLTIMGDFVSNGTALDVPDYVFADDYPLMPLDQLAAFIEAENHLPNIPSADEINGSTLNITQMQMKLLEKVEELTLYTLELDQRNQRQESELAEVKAELAALRAAN